VGIFSTYARGEMQEIEVTRPSLCGERAARYMTATLNVSVRTRNTPQDHSKSRFILFRASAHHGSLRRAPSIHDRRPQGFARLCPGPASMAKSVLMELLDAVIDRAARYSLSGFGV